MEILKLEPAYKDYLWGGSKLVSDYNKHAPFDIVAESWEVSTHPDGSSIVLNGKFKDRPFREYIEKMGDKVIGSNHQAGSEFPILIKFIDAKSDLSIQVHPDDEYALKHEGEYGKTEMWYILDAEVDASIYYGTSKTMSKAELKVAIDNNTILDYLNVVPVKKGDVIFVEAGSIHAIGGGIALCEIQQNSNTTYRLYDFNRKDQAGNLRDLHIEESIAVANLEPLDTDFKSKYPLEAYDYGKRQMLVDSNYFKVEKVNLAGGYSSVVDEKSFKAITVLAGELKIKADDSELHLAKGDSAFIPANMGAVSFVGECEFLATRI